jgi:hypothetical protein
MRILQNNPASFAREVFGSGPRFALLIWIASRESNFFSQREASDGIRYAQGSVSRLLKWLVGWGLVSTTPRELMSQPLHYTRNESQWWLVFRAAALAMTGPIATPIAEAGRTVEVRGS